MQQNSPAFSHICVLSTSEPSIFRQNRSFLRVMRNEHNMLLGTPPGGILLRDPSAAKQDDVTITFYQLQMGCDHHALSAADQQERPPAVNNWPYLHVL